MAATDPTRRLFTVDEYYRMADAGILTEDDRVELIDGEIIQMPPIGSHHASCVRRLVNLLAPALAGRALISCQDPLRLSNRSEPVPDITVLHPRADFYAESHPGPGDTWLVIEVSDTTMSYDQRVKLPAYARDQVPELWLVQLPRELISVHGDLGPAGYQTSRVYRRGEFISPSAFPDLVIAVNQILG